MTPTQYKKKVEIARASGEAYIDDNNGGCILSVYRPTFYIEDWSVKDARDSHVIDRSYDPMELAYLFD